MTWLDDMKGFRFTIKTQAPADRIEELRRELRHLEAEEEWWWRVKITPGPIPTWSLVRHWSK